MTLDEAIAHCDDVIADACEDCANEHRQLKAWLEELKMYRELN